MKFDRGNRTLDHPIVWRQETLALQVSSSQHWPCQLISSRLPPRTGRNRILNGCGQWYGLPSTNTYCSLSEYPIGSRREGYFSQVGKHPGRPFASHTAPVAVAPSTAGRSSWDTFLSASTKVKTSLLLNIFIIVFCFVFFDSPNYGFVTPCGGGDK